MNIAGGKTSIVNLRAEFHFANLQGAKIELL